MSDQVGTDTAEPIAPANLTDRIDSLDFIRGLAVMGILWANIIGFGQPMAAYMYPDAFNVPSGDPTGWMWVAQFVIIDGKMRALFTILFGAGLYLFMERAWARGASRWLQVKRLLILLVFGLFHFFFIWKGDILTGYAVWGLFGLLCIAMKPLGKFVLGGLLFFIGGVMYSALFASMLMFAQMDASFDPELEQQQAEFSSLKADELAAAAEETALKQSGDYAGLVAHNLSPDGHLFDPIWAWLQMSVETFPLILIGMALYRTGFFSGQYDRKKMQLWGWAGLIGGGALALAIGLWTKEQGFSFYATNLSLIGTSTFAQLPMALGMAALLVVYAPRANGWFGDRVRAAGRAAFTNYLGTSILMLFVFHGWAGGLFGELNRPQLYCVAFVTCIFMLIWSKPWLERFRYGPLEWLWRCLTYGKMFPMRR